MKTKCCNAKVHKQDGAMFCSHCISIVDNSRVKKKSGIIYILSVIMFVLFLFAQANAPSNKFKAWNRIPLLSSFKDVELNDSAILAELIKDSCVLPSIAIAQAHIESGHYTSKKTFENHNIFGIKPHKCKYVKGENRYQAVYDSYKDCIACYCHIQKKYLKNIDGHYAANKDYVNLIKKVK